MGGARFPLMRFPGFLSKAFTLSYDDGPVWDRNLIEMMTKYGVRGTFNLNSHRYNFAADDFADVAFRIGRNLARIDVTRTLSGFRSDVISHQNNIIFVILQSGQKLLISGNFGHIFCMI